MIKRAHGNLLEADAEALVNTVNCVGVMGKGVALQFRQAYPENFRRYQQACRAKLVRPGSMLIVPTDRLGNPRFIINFPTKRHWRGKSRLDDIQAGLIALIDDVRRLGIHSIAVPPLGCGNGGLDWAVVAPLIEEAFAALPEVHVLLYEPEGAPLAASMRVATNAPRMTRARALLLQVLHRYLCAAAEESLTRLEIQKAAYFLQAAGEPLRLQFVKHQYGPYAKNLNHVLQHLEGHYIRGYGDGSAREPIFLLPHAAGEAQTAINGIPDALERLERVSQLIEGFESPYGMELLATIHWVTQSDSQALSDPDRALALVQEWSERKRQRFRSEHVRRAWQRLRDQQWLIVPERHGATA